MIFRKSEIFQIFENSISRKKILKVEILFFSKNLKTLFKNLSGTPENSSKRSPQHLGLTSDCCLCSKNICVRLYFVNLLKCSFSFFSNFEGLVLDDHWFDFIFSKNKYKYFPRSVDCTRFQLSIHLFSPRPDMLKI